MGSVLEGKYQERRVTFMVVLRPIATGRMARDSCPAYLGKRDSCRAWGCGVKWFETFKLGWEKWGFRGGKTREKIGYNRVITWLRTPLLIRHNAVTNVVKPKQRGNGNFDRGKNYLMWGGQ